MKRKSLLIGLVLAVSMAFLSSAMVTDTMAGKKKHRLKIAQTLYPSPSAHMDSIHRIADEVKKQTDGRITFKVYGPELGDWNELNEMVNRGDIDMMLSPMSATYDPRWNVTFAPYIVTDYKQAKEVFGPGGFMDEMFRSWAKDINMHWLGTWIQGFAGISLSAQPATSPTEAKGIKVRTPPIAAFECYLKKLGFTPSLIPYSEVPTAISTGVVDGQAGGGPFQTYSCCRDLNKYFVYYRDYVEVWGYTINMDRWNKLDAADQELIQKIVSEEVAKRMEGAEQEDQEYLKKLEEHGLTVVDLSDTPDKLMTARDSCRECWTELDELVGKEWMDKIRKEVGVKTE
ncbi:TRAP transporter substrate-binding protein DctP [Desulfogranum mediterraneum]|uniref:TRAP transporter substrate-binding protein DctP n=1 Tax=Desulfogranum mediterraneum TaxID=160661 RepID=UPI000408CB92|nr:TRAP transporter substrate-binding protein DctP [Desulfogranum mediterraneum]